MVSFIKKLFFNCDESEYMDFTEYEHVMTVSKYFGSNEAINDGWHIQLSGALSPFLCSGIPLKEPKEDYSFYIFRIRKDLPEILELKDVGNNVFTNHPDFIDKDGPWMRFYSKFSSPMVKSANKS